MEKQIRRFKVDFDFDWTYGVEIKKLREDLDALEKLGVTEIEIEPEEIWGSASVNIKAYIDRLETDEELAERIKKEYERQKIVEARELKTLNELKAKYEKRYRG
jgi:hypothetical protein